MALVVYYCIFIVWTLRFSNTNKRLHLDKKNKDGNSSDVKWNILLVYETLIFLSPQHLSISLYLTTKNVWLFIFFLHNFCLNINYTKILEFIKLMNHKSCSLYNIIIIYPHILDMSKYFIYNYMFIFYRHCASK